MAVSTLEPAEPTLLTHAQPGLIPNAMGTVESVDVCWVLSISSPRNLHAGDSH